MNKKNYYVRLQEEHGKYRLPVTGGKVPLNRARFKLSNSYNHEKGKFDLMWRHRRHDWIMEAEEIAGGKIRDFVCITCVIQGINNGYEVVNTHGDLDEYKRSGIEVVFVDEEDRTPEETDSPG